MGKLIAIGVGFALGVLTCGATAGYFLYKNYERETAYNEKRKEIVNEANSEISKITIEGIMREELKQKTQTLETPSCKFSLENAEILKYYKGDNRLVVYIRDVHEMNNIQENIYQTIDELRKENGIDLLVLENLPDEEVTKEYVNTKMEENGILNKVICMTKYGFWTPKTKEEVMQVFGAGVAYEYANDSKVKTYGAEDEDFYNTAAYLAYRQPKSKGMIWLRQKVVLEKRSEMDIKNTLKRMKEEGKEKAIFICGAGHTKSIIETMEKEGVSYLIVQPKGLEEAIKQLVFEEATKVIN